MKNYHLLLKITIVILLLNVSFLSFASNNKILVIPVASFTSATITGIKTTITLTDASTNTPTSWAWSFSPTTVTYQNGTDATSQNPQINFTASGTYSVTLTATNADGSHAITNKIYVVGTATAPYTVTFSGSVQPPSVFPPTDWAVVNPDATAKGIVQSIANEPREVARMDNYSYSSKGQLDDLVMPMMDLSGLTNPQLTFNVAYAPYNAANSERLYIQCSTDGGVTFTTSTYDKSYSTLPTTADKGTGWAPAGTADWRVETVNLLAFKSSNTIIKFVQVAGHGNGLFIHDVKITEGAPLPVELTSFEGKQTGLSNILTWKTASEQNNKGFHIEKSTNGNDWEQISFIDGNGTTTEISNYEFKDNQPFNGENYYRLKQVDFDGKFEYSNIVNITREQSNSQVVNIYPNPASDFLTIKIDNPTTFQIINEIGQIIITESISNAKVIDISNLSAGICWVSW